MEIDGIELRSCPFCGSNDLRHRVGDPFDMAGECAIVDCNNCYAIGPSTCPEGAIPETGDNYYAIRALHAWNGHMPKGYLHG